jgi:hypothetical protein
MTDYSHAIKKLQELADAHFTAAHAMEKELSYDSVKSVISSQNWLATCFATAAFFLENEALSNEDDAD